MTTDFPSADGRVTCSRKSGTAVVRKDFSASAVSPAMRQHNFFGHWSDAKTAGTGLTFSA